MDGRALEPDPSNPFSLPDSARGSTSYIDGSGDIIEVEKGKVEVLLAYLKSYEDIGTAEVCAASPQLDLLKKQ